MSNNPIKYVLTFVLFVLLQGLILNHIEFLGFINPYLYILFIIRIPTNWDKTLVLFLGFLLGMSVDMMSGTPGMHAAATTLLAFLKPHFDTWFSPREDHNNTIIPSARKFGTAVFVRYVTVLTVIHHFAYFIISAASVSALHLVIMKTLASVIFTLILIFILEYYSLNSTSRND